MKLRDLREETLKDMRIDILEMTSPQDDLLDDIVARVNNKFGINLNERCDHIEVIAARNILTLIGAGVDLTDKQITLIDNYISGLYPEYVNMIVQGDRVELGMKRRQINESQEPRDVRFKLFNAALSDEDIGMEATSYISRFIEKNTGLVLEEICEYYTVETAEASNTSRGWYLTLYDVDLSDVVINKIRQLIKDSKLEDKVKEATSDAVLIVLGNI